MAFYQPRCNRNPMQLVRNSPRALRAIRSTGACAGNLVSKTVVVSSDIMVVAVPVVRADVMVVAVAVVVTSKGRELMIVVIIPQGKDKRNSKKAIVIINLVNIKYNTKKNKITVGKNMETKKEGDDTKATRRRATFPRPLPRSVQSWRDSHCSESNPDVFSRKMLYVFSE